VSEKLLQRWLLPQVGTWSSIVAPGLGSTHGAADLLVLVPGTRLCLPVELKIATLRGDRIRPLKVRPQQIAWHDGLQRAGGWSRMVLGIRDGIGWHVWVLDDCRAEVLAGWRKGWLAADLQLVGIGRLDQEAWWRGLVPDKA
jgi:hypothetical protein